MFVSCLDFVVFPDVLLLLVGFDSVFFLFFFLYNSKSIYLSVEPILGHSFMMCETKTTHPCFTVTETFVQSL